MQKIKIFMKNNKKIVISMSIFLAIVLAFGIYFAIAGSMREKKETTSSQIVEKVPEQEVKVEDMTPFEEKGIITGIKDIKVQKGTEMDLEDLVVANADYVKSVVVDDRKVDYSKEGEYEVIYTVTFNGKPLQKFLEEEHIDAAFDTSNDTIIIKIPTTVTVVDEETTKEETEEVTETESETETETETEAEKGNESTPNEMNNQILEENKTPSDSNNNVNITEGTSSSTSSSNFHSNNNTVSNSSVTSSIVSSSPPATCQHVWVTHTETVQEPITTTVTQEKREYTLYRFYWYDTGTWEESRDSSRFNEWYHSANGALYPLYNPYEKPEDNPLFQKYDNNGHPTYINDHTIISGLFEWVPCEPYEKTEITTVTKTVTVCALCGITK